MKLKVTHVLALVALIATVTANEEIDNAEGRKVVKQQPIVIQTPERIYDESISIADYEKCITNRENCLRVCNDVATHSCIDQCPKCPILVVQDVVVQGINDTDYKVVAIRPLNSTNIIRLTNEIHNTIDNNLNNITAHNENNIHIYQKNSTTGGKYGLGYTEHGPCCHVVHHTHRTRRSRVCGERCKARTMYAKPITHCADDTDLSSCRQIFEYRPYRPHRRQSYDTPNRCQYQSDWPFVACRTPKRERSCSRMCLELAYGYILRNGIPLQCVNCYRNFDKSSSSYTPPIGYAPPMHRDELPAFDDDDDWVLEKTKCRRPDGTISEDCDINNELGSGEGDFMFAEPSANRNDDELDKAALDSFRSLDYARRRRNAFRRSKYSHRHKQQATQPIETNAVNVDDTADS